MKSGVIEGEHARAGARKGGRVAKLIAEQPLLAHDTAATEPLDHRAVVST